MNVNSSKLAGELKMNESYQFEKNANENYYKFILYVYDFQIMFTFTLNIENELCI